MNPCEFTITVDRVRDAVVSPTVSRGQGKKGALLSVGVALMEAESKELPAHFASRLEAAVAEAKLQVYAEASPHASLDSWPALLSHPSLYHT